MALDLFMSSSKPPSDVLLFDGLPEIKLSSNVPEAPARGEELKSWSRPTMPIPIRSNMRNVMSSSSIFSEASNGASTLWSHSDSYGSLSEMGGLTPPMSPLPQDYSQSSSLYSQASEMQAIVDFVAAYAEDTPAQPEADGSEKAAENRPARPVSDFRKFKTSMCRSFMASKECPFKHNCIFAHGEHELRSETDNQTLKLANEIIGSAEDEAPRRRTRRRRKGKGADGEDNEAGSEQSLSGGAGADEAAQGDLRMALSLGASPSPRGAGDGQLEACVGPSHLNGVAWSAPAVVSSGLASWDAAPAGFSAEGSRMPLMAQDPRESTAGAPVRELQARLQVLESESMAIRQYLSQMQAPGSVDGRCCSGPTMEVGPFALAGPTPWRAFNAGMSV